MRLYEKTLDSQSVFEGRVVKLDYDKVELENGKEATREVVKHPGGVCIAAITEDDELLFVKQYRYPYHKVVLELPAGKLEDEGNPLGNGIRELREETGAIAKSYVSLGELYPSPGYSDEVIYMYFCKVEEFLEMNPDDDEFLEVIKIPISDAVEMVMQNLIKDAKSQVAILKTAKLLGKI